MVKSLLWLYFFLAFGVASGCADSVVSTLAGSPKIVGHIDGTASDASFHVPTGLATDGFSLFVADTLNNTIRLIDLATGVVTTLAGQPGVKGRADGIGASATFSSPIGIAYSDGNLYVADTGNGSIRRIVLTTCEVSTLTLKPVGGKGSSARLLFFIPYGIVVDGFTLYITDVFNSTIRALSLESGVLRTIAGKPGVKGHSDGIGSEATFSNPMGIVSDGSNLFICDGYNNTIRKLDLQTKSVATIAGQPGVAGHEDGAATSASFQGLTELSLAEGALFISDSGNRTIRKLDLSTRRVTTVAGQPGVARARRRCGRAGAF